MDDASNEQSRGRGKNKREWSKHEDTKLVEALQELATTGWKADNGTFKNGYLRGLEKMLEQKLPESVLKAQPHIESRVKILKKQYNAIIEMLGPNGSGFGWSELDQCVLVEKHIFDDWVKSHPNAAGLRNKSFPHLVPLGQVFGKDRATGYGSEPPEESAHVMIQHDSPIEGDGLDDM